MPKKKTPIEVKGGYIKDAVFAANDGIVTTFAVVAGSQGASLSPNIVLILGFANLFADGFSMAAGDYLGTKSEIEFEKHHGGVRHKHGTPKTQALITFIFYNVGIIPLLPFLIDHPTSFEASAIMVGIALFVIGALRGHFTKRSYIRSGLEMFVIGGLAATVAYVVGFLIDQYIQ